MSKNYVIGIDGGTQSSKVVIFDLDGNVVCEGKEKLRPMYMPRPGVAEHPDDDLWDSIAAASRQAMERFPGDAKSILGVGLCTIRCCRACLKRDGSLASPVVNWMDLRLARPYEQTDPHVCYVTTTSGYITHRLTGCLKDTAANYEGQWPLDKNTWQWSENPEVIKAYKVPKEKLFELVMPGTILGKVSEKASLQTHLPAGLPVVATANDKAVEALGAGLLPGGTGLVSLGTYIGGMVYGKRNLEGAKAFFTNLSSIPNTYLYESGGIRQGMWVVSWFRDLVGHDMLSEASSKNLLPEDILNSEAQQVEPGSEGLITIPEWLAPPDRPFKRGIMIGFHGRHTRAHIYRSILEAIALTMKNHMDCMCTELGIVLERLIISGGGANGDLFVQIFSDVFGIPTVRNAVSGAAGLGAAICAAVATGAYEDFFTAIEKMVKVRDVFYPQREHAAFYEKLNKSFYRNLTAMTDPILQEAYEVLGNSAK